MDNGKIARRGRQKLYNRRVSQPTRLRRFVICEHACRGETHWDLMLEVGEVLATWQVPREPASWEAGPLDCCKIADRRLAYLSYQGALSGERGEVCIKAAGCYEPILIESNRYEVRLLGDVIAGRLQLSRREGERWELVFS